MKTPLKRRPSGRNANGPETQSWPLRHAVWLAVLCWASWAVGPRASAQTPAGLDVQVYAGLSITGAVGTVYSIDYVTYLDQTNNASAWQYLEFLQLPASPFRWADTSAPATGKRFYRAAKMEAPENMVFIPPGTFRMGSPEDEVGRSPWEGPQTDVTISRGFWMEKYELPNPWVLYDMHGNILEWCQDWFGDYPGGTALDPQGPATGSFHVIRGGFHSMSGIVAWVCRSAFRASD